MKNFEKIILIIIIIAAIVGIGFLGYGYYQKLTRTVQNPVATIEVENFGTIKVELYPDIAPNTVANFIKLAKNWLFSKGFSKQKICGMIGEKTALWEYGYEEGK